MDEFMDRRVISAAIALVLAVGAVVLVMAAGGEESAEKMEAPEAGGESAKVTRHRGAPGGGPVGDAPEDALSDGAGAADDGARPPPASPAEEGLYALADAAGKALVRCDFTGFDIPASRWSEQGVPSGDSVLLMVDANEAPSTEKILMFMNGDLSGGAAAFYQDAFVGGLGHCRVASATFTDPSASPDPPQAGENAPEVVEEDPAPMSPEEAEQARLHWFDEMDAGSQKAIAEEEVVLVDVEEKMRPEQVALDTPGLSEGARAWLQARLDGEVEETLDRIDDIEATRDRMRDERDAPPPSGEE